MQESGIRFFTLTNSTKPSVVLPQGNKVVYSSLRKFDSKAVSSGLSIKIVMEGKEEYAFEGRGYNLKSGQYLLVNNEQEVSCCFKSSIDVDGICLFLAPQLLDEVMQSILGKLDEQKEETKSFNVVEGKYQYESNCLSYLLTRLARQVNYLSFAEGPVQEEFFYKLAEALIWSQKDVRMHIKQINCSKAATREELYRRLLLAKEYIHENLNTPLQVRDIAEAAALSEYHFLRTFKQAFGISPYQYILQERVKKAIHLLKTKKFSVSETASLVGFADIYSFSKVFKKITGYTPSFYLQQV